MKKVCKVQISLFDNEKEKARPLSWKYDSQLGIVFYCPNCGKVSYLENKCNECGQKINRKKQVHNENMKIVW
ncbi:hypothetical protein [Terrisporobacter petrolearius]|uniref:hypothetical protein n=1 Tax=Terrisporobacter petrolearius TaxID=1460447 RepID=UPI0033664C9A